MLGWFFGSVGIAEALERTRGLAPTTYGGAFWLAVVVTVAMAAFEVRAMIREQPERRSRLLRFIRAHPPHTSCSSARRCCWCDWTCGAPTSRTS